MVTSRYDLKFLDCDVKPLTNQQTIQYSSISEQEKKIKLDMALLHNRKNNPNFLKFLSQNPDHYKLV